MIYDIEHLLNKTMKLVETEGKKITDNLKSKKIIDLKGFANYVTTIDRDIQDNLIKNLLLILPNSSFVSEEKENILMDKIGFIWVIDPIDGTTNFIHGYPSVTISLALLENGVKVFGIVYNPITQEMFHAIKNQGAFLNNEKIEVSKCKELKDSLLAFGLPYDRNKGGIIFNYTEHIFQEYSDLRRVGPASLDLCYVACGRLDGYFELDLEPWDISAGHLILEEAGGMLTNWWGEFLDPSKLINLSLRKQNVLATNSHIHNILRRRLN